MKKTIALFAVLALSGCGVADAAPSEDLQGRVTDLSFRSGSSGCYLALKAPGKPAPPAPAKPAPAKPAAPKPAAPAGGGVKAPVGGAPVQKPVTRHTTKVYHPIVVPYGYGYGYNYGCYRNDCWRVSFETEAGIHAADCVPWTEFRQYEINDHYPRYTED